MYVPPCSPDTTGSSTPSPNRRAKGTGVSWTDDLPQCQLSDVGVATNAVYLADGRSTEAFQYEDRAFNLATDCDCYLYGVFDGYDGSKAAHFASERLPAELLLGQLTPYVNESSTKSILRQAISVVERGFFETIDNVLAKKTHLQSQIPEHIPTEVFEKRFPQLALQLRNLNDAIKGGTTAVVALVVNNNLYVANVGDSRALLCQKNSHGKLDVQQITVNHDINNKSELERLAKLGLNIEKIMERGKLGMNECTRCIGDYPVKGGYKEKEILRDAISEPVIAVPDLFGPMPLSDIHGGFLVLMSDDVYKSLEQATGTKEANEDIAAMVSHELQRRNQMTGVAQNVIDKIAFLHHRGFGKTHTFSRGDITLVVRNISHPMGADALPDMQPVMPDILGSRPVSVPYGEYNGGVLDRKHPGTLSLKMPGINSGSQSYYPNRNEPSDRSSDPTSEDTPTNLISDNSVPATNSSSMTETGVDADDLFYRPDPHEQLQTDANGKVAPYVSFANFDEEAWLKMRAAKKP